MWKPPIDFLFLHYVWIIFMSIVGLVVLYPYGNLKAVDAYFFGASASTESGLNTVDVKALKTYQQLFIYFAPILTNLGFVNIVVVVIRIHWFNKRMRNNAASIGSTQTARPEKDVERQYNQQEISQNINLRPEEIPGAITNTESNDSERLVSPIGLNDAGSQGLENMEDPDGYNAFVSQRSIQFAEQDQDRSVDSKTLYIPPPWSRDKGTDFTEVDDEITRLEDDENEQDAEKVLRRRKATRSISSRTHTLERAISSVFVLGGESQTKESTVKTKPKSLDLPNLSSHASLGRNSNFYNLSAKDLEVLGGIEYRSLKLLLKIVTGYFFGLHIFGAICLVGWILHADPKYRAYLDECGQGHVWWGFYSAQTMVDNLGFTLTPDSMISFQDATFPMLLMSFLAFAGNTCYPCLLRFIIWVMYKICPEKSSNKDLLGFLLSHPRRCYTLLFPSKPTWILFGILLAMNFLDVLLIIVLDLNNPAVNNLAAGPRVLAAIFQAASARHTGTSTFNLADVSPAVQFSLVVMMYIAIFPIAISIRASNVYEEKTLGVYGKEEDLNETDGRSYVIQHIQNQLGFDLWYIFLGCFCISVAEAGKIADVSIPAFSVFSVLFESVSAYGNVGLSLGYPTVSTSLCGEFTVFSKLVICFLMIRGRHRGLPYKLDRAIALPGDSGNSDVEYIQSHQHEVVE